LFIIDIPFVLYVSQELAGVPLPLFNGNNLVCFRGERTVFAKLDFSLDQGGALILRGANGSGKSSLLRLMAGLSQPLEGLLKWDNVPILFDIEDHNSRLHFVGHSDPVKTVLTVKENLQFWSKLRIGSRIINSPASALKKLGISHLENVHGGILSEGQKRRVNLARILTTYAPLWLLDEPTTSLDQTSEKNLIDAITEHRSEGGMVVISSHEANIATNAQELDLGYFQASSP
jgi:heme exporter protein A